MNLDGASGMRARAIAFAGVKVEVAWSGARSGAIVQTLFCDLPAAEAHEARDTAGRACVARYRLSEAGDEVCLQRDAALCYRSRDAAALAAYLLGDVGRRLAEHSRGGALFHAAALVQEGAGLLLPGGIGAGKTTLAAWLVTRGLGYLTDELAFVPTGADELRTFPRPLNLKAGAREPLRPYFDVAAHRDELLHTPEADLIPASLLGASEVAAAAPLRCVVFPRYRPGAEVALTRLSPARAGLALMRCLVNARNLPDHGFAEVARLARWVPAYALAYGNFSQLEAHLGSSFWPPDTLYPLASRPE